MTAPASPEAGRLTGEALEAIEARAAKATDGPWRACTCGKCGQVWSTSADACVASAESLHDCAEGEGFTRAQSLVNAAFIAASRSDVPALVAEVRRLSATVEAAFREGFQCSAPASYDTEWEQGEWLESKARAALAPVATGPGDARD